jgi:alpha,alpha-trehalase
LSNTGWLKKAINTAKKEYEIVWIDKKNLYNHHVDGFLLSRYGDRDIGYAHSSELESGWDMTSRFYNRCDQFLPIDLNSYLYKYEIDFAEVSRLLGNKKESETWTKKADERKKEINKLMWDKDKEFFFDYGYDFRKQSDFLSLASYTPLWAGLATYSQAKQMLKYLHEFETPYGLTISSKKSLAKPIDISKIQKRFHPAINQIIKPKQWDYPNIWSPLEYLTVIGLLRYGFINDAKRIMKKSVEAHAKLFRIHSTFFEKISGEDGTSGTGALYGDQKGFGWTNAIFFRYIHILDSIDEMDSIYIENPIQTTPPYTLAIPH